MGKQRTTTAQVPKVSRGSPSQEEKPHKPPRGEALCHWATPVSLKGTESRKGARDLQSPHMPEGDAGVASRGLGSTPAPRSGLSARAGDPL